MTKHDLNKYRNIGISAHIDSGKTTLTERILYYTGLIHKISEVRGEGDGAKMDHMELEKERGITITSAAVTTSWNDHTIQIIDTPGHVDFTVEVERSLRVLDGAVLVICATSGIQSQSITVDRQMRRYKVPCVVFINKCDRAGADPFSVIEQLKSKLSHNAVLMQIPIGLEGEHEGVIDLFSRKAFYFDGEKGETVRSEPMPESYRDKVEEYRAILLDSVAMFDDELMELVLEEQEVPEELFTKVVRKATINRELTPVFLGSAFKNKGVQLLLDGVVSYLPSPLDCRYYANNVSDGEKVEIFPEVDKSLVAMAFKITDETFGQLTYTRVYQGVLHKGDQPYNPRLGKKQRVGRMVKMFSNEKIEINEAKAGDIIAMVGVDCASGDTYCAQEAGAVTMESMHVPEPVIELALKPKKQEDLDKVSKALNRFMKEDPTFQVSVDKESNETIIRGMGELHLEIYVLRISREYKAEVEVGAPKVNYREAPTIVADFDYKHKKQTGGSGQYAQVIGTLKPYDPSQDDDESKPTDGLKFNNNIVGGAIPKEYLPGVEKGFRESLAKGPLAGYQVLGCEIDINDGTYHAVDSSEMAFKIASRHAFKQAFMAANPVILEPIMKVEVETPTEFQGTVQGDLSSRRGILSGSDMREDMTIIECFVPLAEMFGYSTILRSMTQGKAGFSMEFHDYKAVPSSMQKSLIDAYQKERLNN
ncbi:MAG: elongation factor G [Proteobacteria bacterium]|nr:elongation factor G [Pseudomonadota bacterium]